MKGANFVRLLTLLLLLGLSGRALGQKRSDRSGNNNPSSITPAGPKRTDRTIPDSERVSTLR